MKAVIQRVTEASVTIDGQVVGEIGHGILLLLGVCPQDGEKEAAWLADKVVNLRIFTDNEDKMNLSLMDGLPVHLIWGLQKRAAPLLHRRRPAGDRRPAVSVFCPLHPGRRSTPGGHRPVWGGYEGGPRQRRAGHLDSGHRRNHAEKVTLPRDKIIGRLENSRNGEKANGCLCRRRWNH